MITIKTIFKYNFYLIRITIKKEKYFYYMQFVFKHLIEKNNARYSFYFKIDSGQRPLEAFRYY